MLSRQGEGSGWDKEYRTGGRGGGERGKGPERMGRRERVSKEKRGPYIDIYMYAG